MITFLLKFPYTSYSAHSGRWIAIDPMRASTWIFSPDVWWGYGRQVDQLPRWGDDDNG